MKSIILTSFLAGAALAQDPDAINAHKGNITVAFYPDSQGDSCTANDIKNAITITTGSIPVSFTCFNVSDVFGHNTSTGFQSGQGNYNDNGDQRNGVEYLLQNQHLYDAMANYSRIWYQQTNSARIDVGKDAPWVLYTYALPNCEQIAPRPAKQEDHPWYETSCQTSEYGQCRVTSGPIVSFGLNTAVNYNSHGCATWAKFGAAAALRPSLGWTVLSATCVVGTWLLG